MRTIDLEVRLPGLGELLELAEEQNVLLRTSDGKTFLLTEVEVGEDDDDFAREVDLTRQNQELRDFLAERSKEPGVYTLDEVRLRLGLSVSE